MMLLKNSIIFLFKKFGYIKNNSYLCDVNNNLKHNDMATKKIIGYQIVKYSPLTKKYDDIPNGMYSFVIFKYSSNANLYAKNLPRGRHTLIKVVPVYEGDIEEPTFFEDTLRTSDNKVERVKEYLSRIPNVTISYVNDTQGCIFFNGLVDTSFLKRLEDSLTAKRVYVTYLPAMVAKGVVICFEF